MIININEKDYDIYFAMQPTVQSGIVKKIIKMDEIQDDTDRIDALLNLVPEILLVGLQKNHRDEFGYDYRNEDEKNEKLDIVFGMVDDYLVGGADFYDLYNKLSEEMLSNGFLASLFRMEAKKSEQKKSNRSKQ